MENRGEFHEYFKPGRLHQWRYHRGTWEFNQTYQGPDEAQKGHMLMKPEFPFNWLID